MPKAVTIAAVRAAVVLFGLVVNGQDTNAGTARAEWLAGRNNGAWLRDDRERLVGRGVAAAAVHALVRQALAGAIAPVSLADARRAYRAGTLVAFRCPVGLLTDGDSVSAVNMALNREAVLFGAEAFTVRAFDGGDGTVVAYVGPPKG